MDHDTVERRVRKIENFLDSQARGWRDEEQWRGRGGAAGLAPANDLVVDEEQTKRDRATLGLDKPNRLDHQQLEQPKTVTDEELGNAPEDEPEIGSTWTDGSGVVWTKTADNVWQSGEAENVVSFAGTYRELLVRPTPAV